MTAIESAELFTREAASLAGIAEEEVRLAAKRSRHTWEMYMLGRATAQEADEAVRAVMAARQKYLDAALRSDGAALVSLLALEADRLEREAEALATKEPA